MYRQAPAAASSALWVSRAGARGERPDAAGDSPEESLPGYQPRAEQYHAAVVAGHSFAEPQGPSGKRHRMVRGGNTPRAGSA